MKKNLSKSLTVLVLLLYYCNIAVAQQTLRDEIILKRYAADTFSNAAGKTPVLVKFITAPDEKTLSRSGVIKALSGHHYILQQLPADSSIRRNVKYTYIAHPNFKATAALLQQLETLSGTDSITVQCSYTKEYVPPATVRTIRTIEQYQAAVLRLTKAAWPAFIGMQTITAADILRQPSPEIIINTINPFVNRINVAQQQFPQVRGKSITVSVREDLFDTTDIDLQGRYVPAVNSATVTSSHATIMATLIGGGGVSGMNGLGVAPAVKLSSSDYSSTLFPDPGTYFRQLGITLQNHSYGTGIENYYGAEAAAYDQQVMEADTILHVFSSGNIGTTTSTEGRYQGIPNFANLSGNYKQAKNVLTAGGTDAAAVVTPLASRGPAYDGRIKPEIVAYGQDGTSGAAALTSGVAALLQDAYRQQYTVAPAAALVKALLINSAVLADGQHPSYAYGYGSLHAAGALATLTGGRYRKGTVTSGNAASFDITVPAGTRQVKITLCWNDPPAAANAVKALVNDLDLSVTTADNKTWQPWVLSSYPLADSLQRPAQRGTDSLNNTEQVTIDLPATGNLHITVRARQLISGPQTFYLAYGFRQQPSFEWQNPVNGSILPAGQEIPLQWETTYSGNGDLSYSLDSGSTWIPIAQQVPLQQPYNWAVPDLFSKALLKLTLTDTSFISPTCYLSPLLTIRTGFNCNDTALIYWQHLPAARAYQVYTVGSGALQPYKQVADSFLFIPKKEAASLYFAVSPVAAAGWEGARSYAVNYTQQGVACYVETLLADKTTGNQVALSLSLGTVYQLKNIYWERLSGNSWQQLSQQEISSSTHYNYQDAQPYEGIVQYRVRLETNDGRMFYSETVAVNILLQHDILVFPNPVISQLSVLDAQIRNRRVVLTDMSGRVVLQRNISDMQETIPVSQLPAGMYNCSIFSGNQRIFSQQLIKQ